MTISNVALLQQYMDAATEHRTPTDPDVVVCLHEIQKWVEVEILAEQGRLT